MDYPDELKIGIGIELLLSMWLSEKGSAYQCKRCEFDPWVRKMPWRRKLQTTPVFLPGESHGQRSLTDIVRAVAKSQT